MRVNVDGLVADKGLLVEAKTCSAFVADDWGREGDQIPIPYLIQVHAAMAVTGMRRCLVGVLIGGQEFRSFTIPRNESLASRVMTAGDRFWREHVEASDPPPPYTTSECAELWPGESDAPLRADERLARWVVRMREAQSREKNAKTEAETARLELARALGARRAGALMFGIKKVARRQRMSSGGWTVVLTKHASEVEVDV